MSSFGIRNPLKMRTSIYADYADKFYSGTAQPEARPHQLVNENGCGVCITLGSAYWTYKTRTGVLNFLLGWFKALRWQRLPEMEKLGEFLLRHLDGIAAYCDHPVRFGVVESLNTTIKAIIRRARGMRDEALLLLKLRWATARPIRSARDLLSMLHGIRQEQ